MRFVFLYRQTSANVPVRSSVTFQFASPCAFSLGKRNVALFLIRFLFGVALREYMQKGFEGSHRDKIKTENGYAASIATLGMRQVRVIDGSTIKGIGREAWL